MIEIIVNYDDGAHAVYRIPEERYTGGLPLDLLNLLFHYKVSMQVIDAAGNVIID